jgi:hypothetical protein
MVPIPIFHNLQVVFMWFRGTVASQAMGAVVAYVEEKFVKHDILII